MVRGATPVGERFLAPDGDDRGARNGVFEEEEVLRGGRELAKP